MAEVFSTADIGRLLGVPTWKVRRLYEDGTLAEPSRIGVQRAIPRDQIPVIVKQLDLRGWLPRSQDMEPLAR